MDAHEHFIKYTGTHKVRRAALRAAKRGEIPPVEIRDDKGEVMGKARVVYKSHHTVVPSPTFERDRRFRRQDTPWRKRVPAQRATTHIKCVLVPIETPTEKQA